ncbi:hypothetical protein [uncultured Fibrella sp.]|uniref:hypothetical protein n=1 Tax=uncultured Fibrella sp. TaxID=1284596 RepID=UPI0035C9D6DB
MTIKQLAEHATDKTKFKTLNGFLEFCQHYLEFVIREGSLQAVIVSQNENHYHFFQYGKSGNYQITRPINSQLMYEAGDFDPIRKSFVSTLQTLHRTTADIELRTQLNKAVYTIQQSIGAALDALPVGQSNKARKINGTLFENFIRLILIEIGIDATAGTVRVPVSMDDGDSFKMNYQHDLIVSYQGDVKAIGSVKTSSKDRIDKIFIDKFLYSKLTGSDLPHIAIFLNDVQRKGVSPKYGISSTFLPGHFRGYTVKLNPLDGVYYCDIRPNMVTEPILRDHIKTFDHLLCTDIWKFLKHKDDLPVEIKSEVSS